MRSPPPLHRNNRNLGQEGGGQSGNLFLGAPHSFFFPFSASGCLPIIHEHPFWGKKASISVYPRKQHWRVQYIITLDTMLVQVKCILFLTHICLYIHPCICPRIFKASLLSSPFFWQELEWMEAPSASSSASASVLSLGVGAFSKVESSQSQSPPRVWAVRSVVCHETQKFFCLHLPRPTHSWIEEVNPLHFPAEKKVRKMLHKQSFRFESGTEWMRVFFWQFRNEEEKTVQTSRWGWATVDFLWVWVDSCCSVAFRRKTSPISLHTHVCFPRCCCTFFTHANTIASSSRDSNLFPRFSKSGRKRRRTQTTPPPSPEFGLRRGWGRIYASL